VTKDELIFRANGGIVGIDADLEVSGGYDNTVNEANPGATCPDWQEPEDYNAMPKAEKLALADVMLDRWTRYREAVDRLG
jgi:hypothetical protein